MYMDKQFVMFIDQFIMVNKAGGGLRSSPCALCPARVAWASLFTGHDGEEVNWPLSLKSQISSISLSLERAPSRGTNNGRKSYPTPFSRGTNNERVVLLCSVLEASLVMKGIARNFVIGRRAPLGGWGTGARKRSLIGAALRMPPFCLGPQRRGTIQLTSMY